jgi:RNA polymerase sigma factor (sigma-70 family)
VAVAADTSEDDRSELVRALQQLPAMQRKVVVLRHWLDLSVEETARELGISTGTVKSHTSRALANLDVLLRAEDVETRSSR